MTVREFYPPGYDPTLDRLPPRRFSCRGLFVLLALIPLLACGGIIFFITQRSAPATIDSSSQINESTAEVTAAPTLDGWIATGTALALNPPTATPTASPTLDDWQATGTALFLATSTLTPSPTLTNTPEPTVDYCWFLTPSPTPTDRPVFVTPDAWAMTGTAVFRASNTPTPERTPTQPPPRVLCDQALPMLLNPATATAPREWPTPLPSFTWLPAPTRQATEQPPQVIIQTQIVEVESEPIYITSEPMIVERPVQVVVTQPVLIQVPAVTIMPIIITATPMPTNTATITPSPTLTATPSPTLTHTPTFTSTFTATATNTATAIPPELTQEAGA